MDPITLLIFAAIALVSGGGTFGALAIGDRRSIPTPPEARR